MHYWVPCSLSFDDPWLPMAYVEEPNNSGPGQDCPVCGMGLGMLSWIPPRRLSVVTYGRPLTDILECAGAGDAFIVTEKFRQMWEAEGLRGIREFEPVEVVQTRKKALQAPPPLLYYAEPAREGDRLDDAKSGVIRKRGKKCACCGGPSVVRIERIVLDPTSITGNDAFYLMNYNNGVFSPRAKDAFDRWGITTYGLVRDDEYSRDFRFNQKHSPYYPLLRQPTAV